jgi:hypothetical protein
MNKENIFDILRVELDQARERLNAERNYLIHLKSTGVPEDSELSRKHKDLEIFYRGRVTALRGLAIKFRDLFQE